MARQLDDCRQLAAGREWDDLVEYVDNDLSAFHGRRRPEYERLLADLKSKRLTAVVAYHPDRLYRHPADLEAFVDAVQTAGAEVATVRAGDVDLSTSSGRMVARILGAVSRQESERIGERVSRAKRERASQGRHSGGGRRPFGLTHDRTALVDDEARVLREAAAAILEGASYTSQVDALNTAGIRNTSGREWTVGNLRRALTSPHIAGLRTYHGTIVGDAAWPAIIDRATWDRLKVDAESRRRVGRPQSERYLLSGLLACSICRRTLYANQTRTRAIEYRCTPAATTTGRGCGKISVSGRRADQHVASTVEGWLQRPTFVAELDAWLTYGDQSLVAARVELDEIERQEVAWAQRLATGKVSDAAFDAASVLLLERRQAAELRLSDLPRVDRPSLTAGDMARAWSNLDIAGRREVTRLVAKLPVLVAPGVVDGRRVAAESRFDLRPVWE